MQGKEYLKMKMYDMGDIRDPGGAGITTGESEKKEKYYPTTYLSSKKIPGIENYDVGDTCKAIVVKKVIGKREKKDGEVEIEFEIRQMGLMGKAPEKSEYDKASCEDKDKMDEKEIMGDEE